MLACEIFKLICSLGETDEQVVCSKRHRDVAVADGRLPSAAKLDSVACGPGPRKVSWEALKYKGCLGLSGGVD